MESERNNLVSDIKKMLERERNRSIFKKYIEYIRFPFFKNFEKDLKVNFNFPITFIVGANGSGKSSLLHALYGSPKGRSVSDFWYTTKLDPIKDSENNRHCFIYGYVTEYTRNLAEVLKTRIKKKDSSGKYNLDYWEPSRPVKKYGMKEVPDNADKREASKTRWNALEKNVYHLDFRYSLSAYDKYFYFGSKPNAKTLKSKQDVIRRYASKLKKSFDENTKIRFRKRKVNKPENITSDELKEIKYILGKDYIETKITEHDIYDGKVGFAVRFKTNKIAYSEAYAGSGETAIVKLVHDLCLAEDFSLVLLDEPETSLHPSAQKRLINFILKQIKLKKFQVVISTHSADMIEGMPPEAIKILYENPDTGKIDIIENVYPENAFVRIGRTVTNKKVILTEDKLSKMIVEGVLAKNGDSELFEVFYYPGGATRLKQSEMTVYSKEQDSRHFIILDGDQRPKKTKETEETGKIDIHSLSDNEKTPNGLKKIIKQLVGQNIKFSYDSNASDDQKVNLMLKYIEYYYNNVFFLPCNTPEEIIWDDGLVAKSDFENEEKKEIKSESDYKEKFAFYSLAEYGSNTAGDIERIHKKFIKRWLERENNDYKYIKDIIKRMKDK